MQHQGHGVSRFLTAHALARVFSTANLLQVGLESCGFSG